MPHCFNLFSHGAHPRSRGENGGGFFMPARRRGSSPLTRGKRALVVLSDSLNGLIPAHAGKTAEVNVSHFTYPAHPRSRGENKVVPGTGWYQKGSSPLTRGKLGGLLYSMSTIGLIPAHAGKTRSCTRRTRGRWAHPRSRGENGHRKPAAHDEPGSSPLTRGKPFTLNSPMSIARLIPAHAGKTAGCGPRATPPGAHPRSRGENEAHCLVPSGVYGSSPLTRGKRPGPTRGAT